MSIAVFVQFADGHHVGGRQDLPLVQAEPAPRICAQQAGGGRADPQLARLARPLLQGEQAVNETFRQAFIEAEGREGAVLVEAHESAAVQTHEQLLLALRALRVGHRHRAAHGEILAAFVGHHRRIAQHGHAAAGRDPQRSQAVAAGCAEMRQRAHHRIRQAGGFVESEFAALQTVGAVIEAQHTPRVRPDPQAGTGGTFAFEQGRDLEVFGTRHGDAAQVFATEQARGRADPHRSAIARRGQRLDRGPGAAIVAPDPLHLAVGKHAEQAVFVGTHP